jgi:hypothetical protein
MEPQSISSIIEKIKAAGKEQLFDLYVSKGYAVDVNRPGFSMFNFSGIITRNEINIITNQGFEEFNKKIGRMPTFSEMCKMYV